MVYGLFGCMRIRSAHFIYQCVGDQFGGDIQAVMRACTGPVGNYAEDTICYRSFFIEECHCLTCNLLRSFSILLHVRFHFLNQGSWKIPMIFPCLLQLIQKPTLRILISLSFVMNFLQLDFMGIWMFWLCIVPTWWPCKRVRLGFSLWGVKGI